MRKLKCIFFIVCFFVLSLLIYFSFFKEKVCIGTNYSINSIENDFFVTGISINDDVAAYDSLTNTYFFNSKIFDFSKIKILSPYKTRYSIEKIDDNKYSIFIYSNKYYQQRYIQVVDSNIISIGRFNPISYDSYEFLGFDFQGRDYSSMLFHIMDNRDEYKFIPGQTYSLGKIRIRGASSSIYEKKSYRLELDSKVSLLGMDADDDWILDSLYSDKSKIRNKLSSDIWNRVNDNQVIDNDLDGEFVEVFIDNHYAGLYVLKERVDSKKTSIDDDGLLVKSVSHLTDVIKKKFIFKEVKISESSDSKYLENYELKKYTKDSLNSFISRLRDYFVYGDYDSIDRNFDFDNYLNYKIFITLIMGEDNITKNQYLSMVDLDSKLLLTPWDMDLTWGLQWHEFNDLHSDFSMNSSIDVNWINDNIIENMDASTFELLKERYWQLRKNVITMDNINNYLDSYKMKIIDSGATMRDSERWYEYDADYEIEQIREWAKNRIDFLDEYFK